MSGAAINASEKVIDLDAWQLTFARTGLGNVTADLIREWVKQGRGQRVRVWAPARVDPAAWQLDPTAVQWRALPTPTARTDFLARRQWSRSLVRALAREREGRCLVVPYLYNHFGRLRRTVVLVPDLVYRAIPFADFAAHPWWDVRRRFYLRRMVMRLEEMLVSRAMAWVTYSEFVARDAERQLGLDRARISVTTLGHGPAFAPTGPRPEELGLSGLDRPYAVYVGGYGSRKNVPMLFAACAAAAEQDSTYRCVFAGISQEALLDHVGWGGGRALPPGVACVADVDDAQLAALYRNSRYAVYPSKAEGFGLPVVEAAACGRCILVADNTSLQELQPDPALRLPDTDPAAWTRAMLHLWQNEAARRKAEAALPALLQGRSYARFAEDMWAAAERTFA